MKATAICLLLALAGASALEAHPFDDKVDMVVEFYLDRDAATQTESIRVDVLYFYDGFFSSYVELQALDLDNDGRVTIQERDARYRVLATDLIKTLKLTLRDQPMKLIPQYDDFELVDMSNPDNSASNPSGMVVKDARIGYTFKFDIELPAAWDGGSHPVAMVLADKRIFIADPQDQLRVFDDRGERRTTIMTREFNKTPDDFLRMEFLWEVKTHTTAPPPDDPPVKPAPDNGAKTTPAQPEQSTRDRMLEMYNERKDETSNDNWVAEEVAKLRDNTASLWVWIVVLFGMFVWGASHAVMPGHGKTLVASYLIGTQGTRADALFLGVVVTAAHTSGVLLLMGGAWAASEFWPGVLKNPEQQLAEMITLAVGFTILAMGVVLVLKRTGSGHHEHDIFGRHVHPEDEHDHPHTHAAHGKSPEDSDILHEVTHDHHHDHDHGHAHDHHHGHSHDHDHSHGRDPAKMTRGEILWLGILGGILPCPSAFVLGLIAFQQQLYLQGLIMVIVFSVGLAVVLSAIGLVLVQTKGYLRERGKQHKGRLYRLVETKLPVLAALVIAMIGIVMVVMAAIRLELINPRSFTV
jgi:ABC-type nickel/cobalt efflux system permease component RcnA